MQILRRQEGLALLVLVFILALAAIGYAVHALDTTSIQNDRNAKTAAALAEAKAALLARIIGASNATSPAFFPNPDSGTAFNEGDSSGNLGVKDGLVLGKFPWRNLGVGPLKDGWNECLWYVVSGNYKSDIEPTVTSSVPFNWDRLGQVDVIDGSGKPLANNIVALIIAPGPILEGQSRMLASVNYKQCGGNYNAVNYLDTVDDENAIEGEVNYFLGSPNGRAAANTANKTFVLANNDNYNDRFMFITIDDIFDPLVKRSDFVNEMNVQLENAAKDISDYSVGVDGDKGTANIDCSVSGINTSQTFCETWKDMFLLKQNGQVNGSSCNKVFIFAGKRTAAQTRLTNDDKEEPANYLEGNNLNAFQNPGSGNFIGPTTFDGENPSADVLKCIS